MGLKRKAFWKKNVPETNRKKYRKFLENGKAKIEAVTDEKTLERIVQESPIYAFRILAVSKIDRMHFLADNALHHPDVFIEDALEKTSDSSVIEHAALHEGSVTLRRKMVRKLSDDRQATLEQIAFSDADPECRQHAVEKLKSEEVLIRVLQTDADAKVRIAAIENPYLTNEAALFSAAKDADEDVGFKAVRKITDVSMRYELAGAQPNRCIGTIALRSILDQLSEAELYALTKKGGSVGKTACSHMSDPVRLRDCALHARDGMVRVAALENRHLTDPTVYTEALRTDAYACARVAAAERVEDEQVICQAVQQDPSEKVRLILAKKLTDEQTLYIVSWKDKAQSVRLAAVLNPHLRDKFLLVVIAGLAARVRDDAVRMAALFRLIVAPNSENTVYLLAAHFSDSDMHIVRGNENIVLNSEKAVDQLAAYFTESNMHYDPQRDNHGYDCSEERYYHAVRVQAARYLIEAYTSTNEGVRKRIRKHQGTYGKHFDRGWDDTPDYYHTDLEPVHLDLP